MLTQQQKDAWIAALRSGNFKQGMARLYTPETDRYCCLGVLAKINDCSTFGAMLNTKDHASIIPVELHTHSADTLVPLEDLLPGATIHFTCRPLVRFETLGALNDNGATFEQIAELLELYLPVAATPTQASVTVPTVPTPSAN